MANQTFWVQARNGLIATAGSLAAISDASVNGDWNLAVVEIMSR